MMLVIGDGNEGNDNLIDGNDIQTDGNDGKMV